jgi:hypothetical protein
MRQPALQAKNRREKIGKGDTTKHDTVPPEWLEIVALTKFLRNLIAMSEINHARHSQQEE